MKVENLLNEIREANLSYLILAQNMIRADRAEALVRLGLSEEVARIIDQLTAGQLHTRGAENAQAAGMHAAILMTGNAIEAVV